MMDKESKEILDGMNNLMAKIAAHYGMDEERVEQIRRGEPIYARCPGIIGSLTMDCLDLTSSIDLDLNIK